MDETILVRLADEWRYLEALSALEDLRRENAGQITPRLMAMEALLLQKIGSLYKARSTAEAAYNLRKEDRPIAILVSVLMDLGDLKGASDVLGATDSQNLDVEEARGLLRGQLGDFEAAHSMFAKLRLQYPQDVGVRKLEEFYCYMRSQNIDDLGALIKDFEDGDRYAGELVVRAVSLVGDNAPAEIMARKFQALHPEYHESYVLLMNLFLASNRLSDAETVAATGMVMFPNSVELRFGLGRSLYYQGHYGPAAQTLQPLFELSPGDARPFNPLLWSYLRSFRLFSALRVFLAFGKASWRDSEATQANKAFIRSVGKL